MINKVTIAVLSLLLGLVTLEAQRPITPLVLQGKELAARHYADSVLATLTPREMFAQCIMPMVWPTEDPAKLKEWSAMITKHRYGGVLWQKGDPRVVLRMTNQMRAQARVPMLVAVDGEWGLSMRLSNTLRWPKNMLWGAVGDTLLVQRYGKATAAELRRLGVHVNFAPTIDVNNNALNPVIGVRSFGSQPTQVATLGLAYARALEEGGVLSCAKHFPGHGNTDVDSHKGLPTIAGDGADLERIELLPFRKYVSAGLGGVMVGHLRVPALGAGTRPTSLSHGVVTGLLKQQMGFRGLVVTDGLAMEGVLTDKRLSVAVEAFKAGSHILLASPHPLQDLNALEKALKRGVITKAELHQRVHELLMIKYALGVHDTSPLSAERLLGDLAPSTHKDLIAKANTAAMTLLEVHKGALPLKPMRPGERCVVGYGAASITTFTRALKELGSFDVKRLAARSTISERQQMWTQLKRYKEVVLLLTSDHLPYDPAIFALTKKTKVILVNISSPYTLLAWSPILPHCAAVTVGYESTEGVQRAMAECLLGISTFEGHLPVDLRDPYLVGTGITTPYRHLRTALPEKVGMVADRLQRIDTLVLQAIDAGTFPGCQVLVARDGKVVYNKAFGLLEPKGTTPVEKHTLYDLASITKAAATVPLVMMALERGLLDLDDPIDKYLTYTRGSNKAKVTIRQLLHHTGGMPASIPFYEDLVSTRNRHRLIASRRQHPYTTQVAQHSWGYTPLVYRKSMVANDSSALYPLRFAKDLYLHRSIIDTMRMRIADAPRIAATKGYRYSDIDFLLLQDILEEVMGAPLDQLFDANIAKPLGVERLLFRPLHRFAPSEIAAGQHDRWLRKQVLRGDVDDESAAMRGGVGGSAGLFGDASSLAVLLQMLYDGGSYDGHELISAPTVQHFISARDRNSPYALGFDRKHPSSGAVAESASPRTFGHQGFTGTCFWIDPDAGLIYIFLSNRTAPVRWNNKLVATHLRPRIHQAIYDAIR